MTAYKASVPCNLLAMYAHKSMQSKTASPEAIGDERLGLFGYPVLQAADILAYKCVLIFSLDFQRNLSC